MGCRDAEARAHAAAPSGRAASSGPRARTTRPTPCNPGDPGKPLAGVGGWGGTQAGAPQWPRRALTRSPALPASAVVLATRRDVIGRPGSASLADVTDPSACFHAPAAGGAQGGCWLLPPGLNFLFFARGSDPFSLGPHRLPLFHNLSFGVALSAFLKAPQLSTLGLFPKPVSSGWLQLTMCLPSNQYSGVSLAS